MQRRNNTVAAGQEVVAHKVVRVDLVVDDRRVLGSKQHQAGVCRRR